MARQIDAHGNAMSRAVVEYLESRYPGIVDDAMAYNLVHKANGTNVLTVDLYVPGDTTDALTAMTKHIRTLGAQGRNAE